MAQKTLEAIRVAEVWMSKGDGTYEPSVGYDDLDECLEHIGAAVMSGRSMLIELSTMTLEDYRRKFTNTFAPGVNPLLEAPPAGPAKT